MITVRELEVNKLLLYDTNLDNFYWNVLTGNSGNTANLNNTLAKNRISLQQQHQPFVFSAKHFRTPMTNHSSNFSTLIRVASEVQNDNRTLITAPSRPHFQCPNCRQGFSSKNSLTVHTNWYKRREQTLTGVCCYCNQISVAGKPASEFLNHLKSAYSSEYANP